MDPGVIALIVGIAAVIGISFIPMDWLKAAGGLLIAATVLIVVVTAGVLLLGH